jgi:Carboxypeptidase regulatory-like domain/TonB dependent receptor-like, beta-barrel
MRKKIFSSLAALTFTMLAAVMCLGQAVNFAQIQGRVTDPTGAIVSGAKIQAVGVATGLSRATISGPDGNYLLPNLPVGPYELRVSANGFSQYVQKGIVLQVGESPTIDVELKVGSVTEKVEVTVNTALVETHDNSISTVIDNSRIMELPLDGRNAPALILLSGAANNVSLNSNDLNSSKNYGNGDSSQSSQSQTISVGGGQENANNYLLDGGDNNDAFSNINAPFPFPDAIQEFNVQSSGLSARYGVHAGAVVNVATKSGTNNFHGNVFEFLRNPVANAHHVFFTPPAPGTRDDTVKRNQFGGTFGGPIVKDKVMFFLGYQATREVSSPNPTSAVVPTAAVLAGDWTAFTTKTLKAPYSGNMIDPSMYNPQAVALLKYIPVATNPQGNLSFTIPSIDNEDQGVAKVDFSLSSKSTLFTRYFATDFRAPIPFDPTDILPQGKTASQFSRYQSVAIGHTYTFTSNLVNAIHVTGTRLAINRGPSTQMISPATIGVNVPSPVANGLVLNISNYFTTGGGSQMPGHFINNLYQVADDVDYIHGKHQLSFGANWMRMQLNYISTFQSNGQFTFNAGSAITGDNLADFMLGDLNSYAQGNPEAENWRYTYFGLYANDSFRVRPNLTLNAGVRWEPYWPSQDAMHRGSHFDYGAFMAGTHSAVFPNAPAGLFFCGDPGIPCSFANSKLAQFSPRAGFVWDPRGAGRETIRASYGLFYDSPEMYFFDRYADNSPYGSAITLTKPAGGFANPYQGQTVPAFPLPFPQAGSNAFFPVNGVYINNPLDMHPMYAQNWNLSFEKQFGTNWVVSASYLGSKTTHIWVAYEANPGLDEPTVATPTVANGGSGCTAGQAASTGNTNCRRALVEANPTQGQFFSNLTSAWDGANATYHGLLLTARHRFGDNFTLLTNYTYSHCISDQDFTGELTNSRPTLYPSPINAPNFANLALDRGNCGFDIRHSLNASFVINSPKIEGGVRGALLNNWQLAPLLTYRTGQYFTVLTGVDTGLTGATTSFKDRPNQVGDPLHGACANGAAVGTRNCWFNTAAFVAPSAGTFGDVGRDSLAGPGAFRLDAAVSRRFAVSEGKELQLRFEAFNVLNHPVLGNPVTNLNSSNFGVIQSQVGDGRTLQGAIKFAF